MEEHLTILPPPPPAWVTLRAAAIAISGRAAAAVVRAVTTILRAMKRRPSTVGPRAAPHPGPTLAEILDRIDGERACLHAADGRWPLSGTMLAGPEPCRSSDRPTRVEVCRRG